MIFSIPAAMMASSFYGARRNQLAGASHWQVGHGGAALYLQSFTALGKS